MTPTIKHSSKEISFYRTEKRKSQKSAYSRMLLALTLGISSSISFNEAYCMEKSDDDLPSYGNHQRSNQRVEEAYVESQARIEDAESIDDLASRIRVAEEMLRVQEVRENVTIILGNTGSGKTTLYHYLRGIPLVARQGEGFKGFVVEREDETSHREGEPGRISHQYRSETLYPCMTDGYYDYPGFNDSRGINQQIVNAYSIHRSLENVQNFRSILVIPQSYFKDRAQDFLNLAEAFGEMFDNNFNSIKAALNIVVTKGNVQGSNATRRFKTEITSILRDNRLVLSPFQIKFLEFLKDERNERITFFPEPIQEGNIPNRNLILSNNFIPKVVPKISLPLKTQLHIEKLGEKLSSSISELLSSFHNNLERHTREVIESHIGTAHELREFFRTVTGTLDRRGDKLENIRNVLERFAPEVEENLSVLMGQHKTLRMIYPQLNPVLDTNIIKDISYYLQPFSNDISYITKPGHLTLKGHIIGTSDLSDYCSNLTLDYLSTLTQITVFGYNSLLIDADIRKPGAHVTFASPFFRVIGEHRSINLQGNEGKRHNFPRALDGGNIIREYDMDGENGLPGLPGEGGGHFYGIVDKMTNGANLTINVNGGRGGPGQDGGHARNGPHGVVGNREEVEVRARSALISCTTLNEDSLIRETLYREKYRSGSFGENGGDAGAGGIGGIGGYAGTILLENLNYEDVLNDIRKEASDGVKGDDGNHGAPGYAGSNGIVFEGTYDRKEPGLFNAYSEGDWKVRPHQRAPSYIPQAGKEAQYVNEEDRQEPDDNDPIDHKKIRLKWEKSFAEQENDESPAKRLRTENEVQERGEPGLTAEEDAELQRRAEEEEEEEVQILQSQRVDTSKKDKINNNKRKR